MGVGRRYVGGGWVISPHDSAAVVNVILCGRPRHTIAN